MLSGNYSVKERRGLQGAAVAFTKRNGNLFDKALHAVC